MHFTSIAGCTYMGVQYEEGEQIQPNCSTRCTCQLGQFECQAKSCSSETNATCSCNGDPHCRTFDYLYYDFQGDCEYVLTEPCDTSEFRVIVRNGKCSPRPDVSCTENVTVLVPNDTITMIELGRRNGGTVTINRKLQPNNGDGIIMQSSRVTVRRSGGHPLVLLPKYGVRIFWNGARRVKVTVSQLWQNKLCGLCGDYNGNKNDDFKMPNGILAPNATAFGDSWQYNETSLVCNRTLDPPDNCTDHIMMKAKSVCAIMNQTSCNNIDPNEYIKNCIFDYCYGNETDKNMTMCESFTAFADDCSNNNPEYDPPPTLLDRCKYIIYIYTCICQYTYVDECKIVKRTTFLTGNPCTGGKIYRHCGPVCPQTCTSSTACNSSGCAEGCFCPDGQVENSDGLCRNCTSKLYKHTYVFLNFSSIATFQNTEEALKNVLCTRILQSSYNCILALAQTYAAATYVFSRLLHKEWCSFL